MFAWEDRRLIIFLPQNAPWIKNEGWKSHLCCTVCADQQITTRGEVRQISVCQGASIPLTSLFFKFSHTFKVSRFEKRKREKDSMNHCRFACRVLPQLSGGLFLTVITRTTWPAIILPLLGLYHYIR